MDEISKNIKNEIAFARMQTDSICTNNTPEFETHLFKFSLMTNLFS